MRHLLSLAALIGVSGSTVSAGLVLNVIGPCNPTDVSADGSVIVGNTVDYGTFRYTIINGLVDLGRNSFTALGRGAGSPDVSADGLKISATIVDETGTLVTAGRWVGGQGWTDLMPPGLPDSGVGDESIASGWGMSEDGETVVGLYWRFGQPGGTANGLVWDAASGLHGLGPGDPGRDSRANECDADGNVIVGWESNWGFGNWQACVWEDGVQTLLSTVDAFTEASTVNPAGTIIAGSNYNETTHVGSGSIWRKNDSGGWDEEVIGALPGSVPHSSTVYPNDMTPDGGVIVGFNRFGNTGTGFIWTPDTGMVNVNTFLSDNGLSLPETMVPVSLTAISNDGNTIAGIAQEIVAPWRPFGFFIRGFTYNPPCPGDMNHDGEVDFTDLNLVLGNWGQPVWANTDGDGNADANVDFADLNLVLGNWGNDCF